MGLLHGPGIKSDLLEAPKLPLVAEALMGPGLENDFERFIHPLPVFFPGYAENSVIQRRVPGTNTELEPAARDRIHHGVVLGALQRMAQRQDGDARTQPNARCAR